MAHKAPEIPDFNENIQKGIISEEEADQIREGHGWGFPLAKMIDLSGVTPKVGTMMEVRMLENNSFEIPQEGGIVYGIKSDPKQEGRVVFVNPQEKEGEMATVENKSTVKMLSLDTEKKEFPLEKGKLPHKGIWNRIEEGNIAKIDVSKTFRKVENAMGTVRVHLDQHTDFFELFDNKFNGIVEILSQNVAVACFGPEGKAGTFQKVNILPLEELENIDFSKELSARFMVYPTDVAEQIWKVIIAVQCEEKPILNLEINARIIPTRALEKKLMKQPQKIIEDIKKEVESVVEREA